MRAEGRPHPELVFWCDHVQPPPREVQLSFALAPGRHCPNGQWKVELRFHFIALLRRLHLGLEELVCHHGQLEHIEAGAGAGSCSAVAGAAVGNAVDLLLRPAPWRLGGGRGAGGSCRGSTGGGAALLRHPRQPAAAIGDAKVCQAVAQGGAGVVCQPTVSACGPVLKHNAARAARHAHPGPGLVCAQEVSRLVLVYLAAPGPQLRKERSCFRATLVGAWQRCVN